MYAFILLFCLLYNYAYSARILAVFPHTGKSHFDVFEPLVLTLAKRGHDVSVLSFFPQKQKVENLTDYSLVGTVPIFVNAMSLDMVDSINGFQDFHSISKLGLDSCEPVLSSETVTKLINSDKEFDLLIFEIFNIDCFLGFAHRFKAPYIGMSSTGLMPIHNGRFGNPQNPANVPNIHFQFCDKMSFVERIKNTVSVVLFQFARTYYYDAAGEKIARKYFGADMPSVQEIANNAQLFFTNTHYSIHRPRPLVPAIVPVGGLHINPAKKLPQDVERFINESSHGVVLFSMGSILLANTIAQEKREAFISAFSELPQRFIMKWENSSFPNQPSNLKILNWLPQRDILAHPNVVAFITHGGLLGLSEAVYSGVPIIGVPIFGDQPNNIASIVSVGAGLKLDYATLTKESVLKALKAVIYDRRYKDTATKLSSVYKDRPAPPLDTAVYWTEFVLRHNGTPFLQSAAVHQSWYQNLLLDVVAALIISLTILLKVVFLIARRLTVLLTNILYSNNSIKKNL